MRELKFRAWDKDKKIMLEPFWIKQLVVNYCDEFNYGSCSEQDIFLASQNDLEFMQFTGFKDKNEKEICEGDRVTITDEHGNTDSGIVWYVPERMTYCIVWSELSTFNLSDTKKSEIEISGNKYESQ